MTNLSNAAGSAAVPNTTMANVIDSLKRLERIGSEHSETTRKIIEAAVELSEKIVSLYPESVGYCVVADNTENPSDDDVFDRYRAMKYGIHEVDANEAPPGRPRRKCRVVYNELKNAAVYESRDAALQFASDVANGLLGMT